MGDDDDFEEDDDQDLEDEDDADFMDSAMMRKLNSRLGARFDDDDEDFDDDDDEDSERKSPLDAIDELQKLYEALSTPGPLQQLVVGATGTQDAASWKEILE